MIIIVFGLPGSGKSYFAANLADMIKGNYINSDQVRRKMFGMRLYSEKEKLLVYDELLKQMHKAVEQHKNVVLDATFYISDIRKKFLNGAKDVDDIFFIEVIAEESLIRERLKKPRKYSEADFKVYKKIKKRWEPMSEDHLILQSTDNNIGELLEKTAAYLHLKK